MTTKRTVLIVEDDQEIRETLKEIVAAEGYHTLEAQNGRVALDLIDRGNQPCLILLDLMMPEMNGWEFLEKRRQNAVIAAIPTVVVTAAGLGATPFGATSILKKPILLLELISLIEKHCGKNLSEVVRNLSKDTRSKE
jgi:CheY-like chemotaxis protein